MPVQSKAQSRYLHMKFGDAWMHKHGFDQETAGLPEHTKKKHSYATDRHHRIAQHALRKV